MKKILLVILMLFVAFGLSAQTAIEPNGEGSEEQPYQIASLENLYWLQTQNFPNYAVQTADINASETYTWFPDTLGGYYGWPIGTASGNYNGQGFAIDSLYINRPSTDYVSLFGNAYGSVIGYSEIKNLRLTNVDITGNSSVGALVGIATKYNITNCSSSGAVSGTSSVGGIAGRFNAPYESPDTLLSTYSTATITAASNGGGLVGSTTGATDGAATVLNCYAKGSVTNGGGLIGSVTKSSLLMCYATGAVTTGGGLVGSSDSGGEGGTTDFSCYWDYQTVGQLSSPHGTAKSTAEMKTQGTFIGWDFVSTWTLDGIYNDGYSYLQENLPEDALPITLAYFNAEYKNGYVQLTWETASETDNAHFLIYRDETVIGTVEGAGTTSEPHYYSYIDNNLVPGVSYVYTLGDVSYANEIKKHDAYSVTVVAGESSANMTYSLEANYPNPFNPSTIIPYTLSHEQHVTLNIFDISGKLVRSLVNEQKSAGHHAVQWNGKNDLGIDMKSGMYISKITAGGFSETRKMLLVK